MSLSKRAKIKLIFIASMGVLLVCAVLLLGRGSVSEASFHDIASPDRRAGSDSDFLKKHEEAFAGMAPAGNANVTERMIRRVPSQIEYSFPHPEPVRADAVEYSSVIIPDAAVKQTKDYFAKLPVLEKGSVKVAIIIDDMGMSYQWTQGAIDIGVPMTMAFLPYAEDLESFTADALSKGHELLIHTPMEPLNPDIDMGPIALRTGMTPGDFMTVLDDQVFPSFKGYVGINNHMGSKLTQDKEAMALVMSALKERGLFFVDSKTIHTSVAASMAARYGVPYAVRDVFLDHVDAYDDVMQSLASLERVARKKGYAIAIGHPKEHTVKALRDWLPGAIARGVEVVPVGSLLTHMEERAIAQGEGSPAINN